MVLACAGARAVPGLLHRINASRVPDDNRVVFARPSLRCAARSLLTRTAPSAIGDELRDARMIFRVCAAWPGMYAKPLNRGGQRGLERCTSAHDAAQAGGIFGYHSDPFDREIS